MSATGQIDMQVEHYISKQLAEWQQVMTDIHSLVVQEDKTVVPLVEPMMGKEMIVYKAKSFMKYGFAAGKNYMSLHVLPIYGSKTLYEKYKALLDKAKFQKGCINFDAADEMPLEIVKQLFTDCAKIDLLKIREEYLKEKKLKGKSKS